MTTPSLDVHSSQLASQMLAQARRGETESFKLLQAAQEANMAFTRDQSNASKARRAVLAKRAYETRINAELGRTMAAYALLADREGNAAQTARQALQRVQDAKRREVLVDTVKGAERRRSIMLQAVEAAKKAFDAAPGLPESVVSEMPGPAQTTMGMNEMFRPPSYIKRAGAFFPMDVRAAAGTLKGLDEGTTWDETFTRSISDDAAAVVKRAHELASEVASQDPATAGLAEKAKSMTDMLKARHADEAAGRAGFPWLHVVGGGAVLYVLWKVFR